MARFKKGDPLTPEVLERHKQDLFTRAKDQPFYWVGEAVLRAWMAGEKPPKPEKPPKFEKLAAVLVKEPDPPTIPRRSRRSSRS